MLPTEKATFNQNVPIIKYIDDRLQYLNQDFTNNDWVGQHLYILSDDKIEKGDWVYNPIYKTVYQWIKNAHIKFDKINAKKIIASTAKSLNLPQLSQSFIQKYVEAYNSSNIIKEVMVEYDICFITDTNEMITKRKDGIYRTNNIALGWTYSSAKNEGFKEFAKPKVSSKDNTISISKIKDSWSREEVASVVRGFYIDVDDTWTEEDCDKWIEENL